MFSLLRGREFFSHSYSRPSGSPGPLRGGYHEKFSVELKRPAREAQHSHPYSAGIDMRESLLVVLCESLTGVAYVLGLHLFEPFAVQIVMVNSNSLVQINFLENI